MCPQLWCRAVLGIAQAVPLVLKASGTNAQGVPHPPATDAGIELLFPCGFYDELPAGTAVQFHWCYFGHAFLRVKRLAYAEGPNEV